MPRKKRERKEQNPEDRIPDVCFRCSRCGRPWLKEQATYHKGGAICAVCQEAFEMAVLQAKYQAAELEHLLSTERQKKAHLN